MPNCFSSCLFLYSSLCAHCFAFFFLLLAVSHLRRSRLSSAVMLLVFEDLSSIQQRVRPNLLLIKSVATLWIYVRDLCPPLCDCVELDKLSWQYLPNILSCDQIKTPLSRVPSRLCPCPCPCVSLLLWRPWPSNLLVSFQPSPLTPV